MRKQQPKQHQVFASNDLFNAAHPHVSELALLRKTLEVQFNESGKFEDEPSMKAIIPQLEMFQVANLKEALLLLLICFRKQYTIGDLLRYEEIHQFKGQRQVCANSLKEALLKYKCNSALNPITDFKQIMSLMRKQYGEACRKAILNLYSQSDAKHLLYEALVGPKAAEKQLQEGSFAKLNISLIGSYPTNNSHLLLQSIKIADKLHVVDGVKKECHVYICPNKTEAGMVNFWLIGFQSFRKQRISKILLNFQNKGYLESPEQRKKRISQSMSHSRSPQRPSSPPVSSTKIKNSSPNESSPKKEKSRSPKQASPSVIKQISPYAVLRQANQPQVQSKISPSLPKQRSKLLDDNRKKMNDHQSQEESTTLSSQMRPVKKIEQTRQGSKQVGAGQNMKSVTVPALIVLLVVLAVILSNMSDDNQITQTSSMPTQF